MRLELIDYQREAAVDVVKRLGRARSDWSEHEARSAFALSAMTGSGKTIIATAVIEAFLYGSSDLGVDPDPRATFLWVTDDPALNRQTRNKMLTASDLLSPNQLSILNDGFLDDRLTQGCVYFLNIQQLAKSAGFAKGGSNFRAVSGWDVIGNTIMSGDTDLYLVLDEAHRGMKGTRERVSIVRQIIGGQRNNPAVPAVWGISATIERFQNAIAEHADRTVYPAVDVSIERVRASGLVKDRIELFEPDESGTFTVTLLRQAVAKTREFDELWHAYSTAEHEPRVAPVLVVQVPDKPPENDLRELVAVIEQEWPGLDKYAITNVFGEHTDLIFGSRKVRYVAPETIQDDPHIRVVLAKEAISTGWDCPRAEVLYSERPASDATHIAQVIGRMIRQPLARRITTNDALNSVWCYLPKFKLSAVSAIVSELNEPGEAGAATEVVVHAASLDRNPTLTAAVFEAIENAPCLPAPDPLANPIKRAKALVKLLTDGSSGSAMLPNAGAELTGKLNSRIAGLAVEHAAAVDAGVADIEELQGRHTVQHPDGRITTETKSVAVAASDINRDTRRIIASVKEGVAKDYLAHVARTTGVDVFEEQVRLAALMRVSDVVDSLNTLADDWVKEQLTKFRVQIKHTTGATRDAFLRVTAQTTHTETAWIELPAVLRAATRDGATEDAAPLPTFDKHLFADSNGQFPAKLNAWETEVLETELARSVAWYRNPSRASVAAHRIGYQNDNDDWSSLQVDFLFATELPDGSVGVSIIDPHGDHFADARPKLMGLARFAAEHGGSYVRIESISETDTGLMVLDMQDDAVRAAVMAFDGAQVSVLYESIGQRYA